MKYVRLGNIESQFADLVWKSVPLTTRELVNLCEEAFSWKRTTTYTVLKKCCEKGLFELNSRIVTAKLTRDEFYARQSAAFVENAFDGSLPAFVAAFASCAKPSKEELDEVRKMIDSFDGASGLLHRKR